MILNDFLYTYRSVSISIVIKVLSPISGIITCRYPHPNIGQSLENLMEEEEEGPLEEEGSKIPAEHDPQNELSRDYRGLLRLKVNHGAYLNLHQVLCMYFMVVQLGGFVRILMMGVSLTLSPDFGTCFLLLGCLFQP